MQALALAMKKTAAPPRSAAEGGAGAGAGGVDDRTLPELLGRLRAAEQAAQLWQRAEESERLGW